ILLAGLKLRARTPPDAKRPDILFICSDAHRWDYAFGAKGKELMPRLQEFAKSAVVYNRAYSNSSWTLPSVTTVMTGLAPRYHLTGKVTRTGLTKDLDKSSIPRGQIYLPWDWEDTYRIVNAYPKKLTTLTEILQVAGYRTALIYGNDIFTLSGLAADGQDAAVDTLGGDGEKINRAAAALLDSTPKDQPLFLMAHFIDVHQYLSWYFLRKHPNRYDYYSMPEDVLGVYAEAVRDCDRFTAELLDKWDKTRGLENSLVIFYSDHGEHLFDPGFDPVNQAKPPRTWIDHARLRVIGHGNSMEEVMLHVPLLARFPKAADIPPAESDAPVCLADLFPTALDVAGILPAEMKLSGISLLALRRNPPAAPRDLFADYLLVGDDLSSVREENYKWVVNPGTGAAQLLDLTRAAQPKGESEQAAENPEIAAKLKAAYEAYAQDAEKATEGLASEQAVDQEDAAKRLRNLNYLK
ncbi:sulfatase-like hydrolase/transferase, partial [Candidatus Sumerlaeota bacterium]|nr:sulfatase-like hydrolase/transferase [Candidatus Sumerlaeota bacterium]